MTWTSAPFVDLKTTGPDIDRDRVIDLVVIRTRLSDAVPLDAADRGTRLLETGPVLWTRVNPDRPIAPFATALHGISDADVGDLEPFRDHAHRVREFIGDLPLVAHDALKVSAFLDREFAIAGVEPTLDNRMYCTGTRFARESRRPRSTIAEMGKALNLATNARFEDARFADAGTVFFGSERILGRRQRRAAAVHRC